MKPHVVAAIFARGGSKGVPRKNVKPLAGKPLIGWAIDCARAVSSIDRVIVSTDDAEIAAVATSCGAEVPFMRPAELARDDSPEWKAWQHAILTLEAAPGSRRIDALVSVPTTSPLRAAVDVQSCLDMLLTSDADIVITVCPANRNPYFNMVTVDGDGRAAIVIRRDGEFHTRQAAPKVFDITTVAYAARRDFVLNSNGVFDGKVRAVVVPAERAIDIDTPLDFRIAEILMADRLKAGEGGEP